MYHIPPVQGPSSALWQPHHQSPAVPCCNRLTLNVLCCIYNMYNSTLTPSAGIKQEFQMTVSGFVFYAQVLVLPSLDTSSVQSYLSFGFSTYFLNCLTLLSVCSANSLDGSMIRALGPFDDVFTWLTLALPAQTQKQWQLFNTVEVVLAYSQMYQR